MTETESVGRAARRAIARAKRRRADLVTPDDLLLGLLTETSRFGIALLGTWMIDVAALDGEGDRETTGSGPEATDGGGGMTGGGPEARGARPEATDGGPRMTDGAPAPAYATDTVRLFERGAELAREDGAVAMGLVHLLAAYADEPSPMMEELRRVHGFSSAEWRGALARGEVGPWGRPAGTAGAGTEGARGRNGHVPDLMSVDEAAEYLGVHAQTVRNYIRGGKLPAYRLAGERYIRVLRKDLLALLEKMGNQDPERSNL